MFPEVDGIEMKPPASPNELSGKGVATMLATVVVALAFGCWAGQFLFPSETISSESAASRSIRSSKWPAFRAAYLGDHPTCDACGCKEGLEVHHIFPVEQFPALELNADNLITLCDRHSCHLMIGHLGDFHAWNPLVREDAARMLDRVKVRPKNPEEAKKFRGRFSTAK